MNSFTLPNGLPFMINYKKEKESRINVLINNLKISDVKEDKVFAKTTEHIKKDVLIEPVAFRKPKLIGHKYYEKPLTMEQQLIGGISKSHYIHEISFPFSGDSSLFSHIPENGYTFGGHDHGLIPPVENAIDVEVDLPELNPDRAIVEARSLLSMTIQFVDSNNSSLQAWSISVANRIDEQLNQKRAELINLFG